MIRFRRPFLFLSFVAAMACGGNPVEPTPAFLATLIQESESQPVANPPVVIARYDYRGEPVYFVPERCCDVMSTLYRADGSIVCHPSGGITGAGDGRCADFLRERRNERILWRDSRGSR